MEITFIKNIDGQIEIEKSSAFHSEPLKEHTNLWVAIQEEGRKNLKNILSDFGFNDALYARVLVPGEVFRVQKFNDSFLLDINVLNPEDLSSSIYVTFIFRNEMIYSICDVDITRFGQFIGMVQNVKTRNLNSGDLMSYFFGQMIDDDLQFGRKLLSNIDGFSKKVFKGFDSDDPDMISAYKTQAELLNAVLENQFLTIALIPDISDENTNVERSLNLNRIESHLQHLRGMAERAEDKLNFLLQQYQSEVQELSNRRINTLTIVQAIFVPLTFIAGIYGMNFKEIPELDWNNGYFYALFLMAGIALLELFVFWRRGWFK
jgi:magnesium transporter